ncbi:hypothetical protein HS99_0009665 [Kitasatospora aureofaciens]|uniref:Uncharacterized protein n=1 Tax=Kitasatospora aureofaciens TaxID=1894 RepID=A0A1E7N244_KITAU|nr:hypothetical protein B6264_26105 [Kitasatospora aureofaciens]OEV34741.1 hypothetical protein HS99_0009665 [Kitasatospora aureofaciens]QEV03395.1 hypothetical protein CP971_33010 [Streptomyces viridifaciens]
MQLGAWEVLLAGRAVRVSESETRSLAVRVSQDAGRDALRPGIGTGIGRPSHFVIPTLGCQRSLRIPTVSRMAGAPASTWRGLWNSALYSTPSTRLRQY